MLLIDTNNERSLTIDKTNSLGDGHMDLEKKTHMPSPSQDVDQIKVHIDTLEPFSSYGGQQFIMTSVKEIKVTTNFLKMPEEVRKCGNEVSFQDCKNSKFTVEIPEFCNCTPPAFGVILSNKVFIY